MNDSKTNKPLHIILREELENDILSGKYKPGDMIPSENELAEKKNVSRPTVRQAFSELVSMGLLKKVKGKGTFVTDFDKQTIFDHTKGFMHTLLDCNDNKGREIISVYMVDAEQRVGFEKLSDIFDDDLKHGISNKFIKTEYSYKELSVFCESYLPMTYFPEAYGLLEKNSCAFDLLAGKIPIEPRSARCEISISRADEKKAKAMNITKGTPLIKLQNSLLNGRGMTVEYCICYYKTTGTNILFNKIRKI